MSEARTLWEEGHEPGHRVVALAVALLLSVVCLDLALDGRVGWLSDVGFVPVCVAVALLVRPRDFFTVGVLPPLLLFGVFVALAATRPEAIAHRSDGVVQATVSGLSTHAVSLGVGYALCLACLWIRDQVARSPGRPLLVALDPRHGPRAELAPTRTAWGHPRRP